MKNMNQKDFVHENGSVFPPFLSGNTLRKFLQTTSALSTTSKQCFERPAASFLVCSLIFVEYTKESTMKTFLLGFAEGYFIVSLIIYISTYLMLKNPINTLFYPEIYPVLFGLFYLGYKVNKKRVE